MTFFKNSMVGVCGTTLRPWVLVRTDLIVWFGQLQDEPRLNVKIRSAIMLADGRGQSLPGFDSSPEACLALSCRGFQPVDLEAVVAMVIKHSSSLVHVVDYHEVYEFSREAWGTFTDALYRAEERGRSAPLPAAPSDPASRAIAAAAGWPMGWDKMPRGFKGE